MAQISLKRWVEQLDAAALLYRHPSEVRVDEPATSAGSPASSGRSATCRPSTSPAPSTRDCFMPKSVSLHTEIVFSQITYGGDIASQGRILGELAADAAAGQLRPIVTTLLEGLSTDTMRKAHELIESGRTVGKIVISV